MKYVVVFFVLLILFLLSRIRFYIEYKRRGEDDIIVITVEYLKLKKQFEISLVDIAMYDEELGFKFVSNIFRKKEKNDDEGFIDLKTIIRKIKRIRRFYKLYKNIFDDILNFFNKKIQYEDIDIKLEEGTGNPSHTAIIAGILYSIVYSIYGWVSFGKTIKKHSINIIPDFKKQIFKINISCIFKIRIGNIIYVGTRILLLLVVHSLKKRKKILLTTNINKRWCR